ncbi:MAG: hypothetical protein ACLP81_04770 [Acidimicrobiales bacterium]
MITSKSRQIQEQPGRVVPAGIAGHVTSRGPADADIATPGDRRPAGER